MTGITCALAGGSGSTGTLTSVTFTSNGTWVAPVGVSTVVSASGKGAAGVSDYGDSIGGLYCGVQTGSAANPPYAQWGTVYGSYQTALSQISSRSYPGYGPSTFIDFDAFFVDPSDRWGRINTPTDLSGIYVTGYSSYTLGAAPTSGNLTYASISGTISGWGITVSIIAAGGAGAASTALGRTFPGGSYTGSYPNGVGNPAVTTTYTNIAVTPGTSYSIVVPSGGEVTLQYYL